MPQNKYIKVSIDGEILDLPQEGIGLSINYQLEDIEDFQKKKSSESFDITFPATPANDRIGNTLHNPAIDDNTTDKVFSSHRKAVIEANGHELLVGKAFLTQATHTDKPQAYTFDFYGNNADWIIELKEATLFDCLKHITFPFEKAVIEASWAFDGSDETLPYVFAPVRYGQPMESMDLGTAPNIITAKDYNMLPVYMKPSLSKYWILFWGFKLAGYRINSQFFNTEYFRRQVMPWTWGNFLDSEGTKTEIHKFLAVGPDKYFYVSNQNGIAEYLDCEVTNDHTNPGFDANNTIAEPRDYEYISASKEMRWTYNTPHYGTLEAFFSLTIDWAAIEEAAPGGITLYAEWYHNGVQKQRDLFARSDQGTSGFPTLIFSQVVLPDDYVSVKIFGAIAGAKGGTNDLRIKVTEFKLDYFRIPLGGTIAFDGLYSLKKYKFLDFLKGIADEFNLAIQTDSVTKVVTMEPLHAYALGNDLSITQPGYLNGDFIDWQQKQDLSKVSTLRLFSDYEREVVFAYKDDTNDGALKVVQDRNQSKLATGKFLLPARFKEGKKEVTNTFFSPTVHYEVTQWGAITGINPQMVVMVPENISNTSRDEAQNTFAPKSCYYKGLVAGAGGWVFDGEQKTSLPYMFAVNYQPGGEHDPVLSYSDERIGLVPGAVLAKGLLRRFYLQRMAIMRLGKYYTTHFLLNNNDVTNWLHREHIVCRAQRWELVNINSYKPLSEESTECQLRKWTPITPEDGANVFPSSSAVVAGTASASPFDTQYFQLKCLTSDIPTPTEE